MARIDSFPLRVKMTRTTLASPNGYRVEQFYEGQEYDLPPVLASVLEGNYVVVKKEEVKKEEVKKEEVKKEERNAGVAPKNKSAAPREHK